MTASASNAVHPVPHTAGGARGVTRALAFIVEAQDAEAMASRAAMAIGVLPSVRWAELDSPWTSGADLVTVELFAGQRLTVAMADPRNEGATAEVVELLGVIATMVARERRMAMLAEQARSDALTGLWNRRAFDELIDQALSRAARTGEHVALLICDVDNFKAINDRHGHPAGDRALTAVADAIREITRPSDVAARIGGDEIAILLAGCDADGAQCAASRLRDAVQAANPLNAHALTLSIGIADVHMLPTPVPTADRRTTLLRLADEALYMAKHAGRDVAVAHPGANVVDLRAA